MSTFSYFFSKVQTRQWACNSGNTITCNCGAALRDHNDVIEFSCCNNQLIRDDTTPITVKKRSKNCLAPGISIKNVIQGINGEYEVRLLHFVYHDVYYLWSWLMIKQRACASQDLQLISEHNILFCLYIQFQPWSRHISPMSSLCQGMTLSRPCSVPRKPHVTDQI